MTVCWEDFMGINVNYPLPLYFQVKEDIIEKIEQNEYKLDTALPSEQKLMEEYKVSRTTIRQAVDLLVSEGCLERRRGLGTFVTNPKVNMWELEELRNFKDEVERQGLHSKTTLMTIEIIKNNEELHAIFKEEYQEFYRLERLRYVNDKPSIFVTTYIPVVFVPNLHEQDLSQNSLFDILGSIYHIDIGYALKKLKAINASKADASLLGIKENKAIQLVNTVTYDQQNNPIEYSVSKDRGDVSEFMVRMQYKKHIV